MSSMAAPTRLMLSIAEPRGYMLRGRAVPIEGINFYYRM